LVRGQEQTVWPFVAGGHGSGNRNERHREPFLGEKPLCRSYREKASLLQRGQRDGRLFDGDCRSGRLLLDAQITETEQNRRRRYGDAAQACPAM